VSCKKIIWIDSNKAFPEISRCSTCDPSDNNYKYEHSHILGWEEIQKYIKCEKCQQCFWNSVFNTSNICNSSACDPSDDFTIFKYKKYAGWIPFKKKMKCDLCLENIFVKFHVYEEKIKENFPTHHRLCDPSDSHNKYQYINFYSDDSDSGWNDCSSDSANENLTKSSDDNPEYFGNYYELSKIKYYDELKKRHFWKNAQGQEKYICTNTKCANPKSIPK
jgi:hypothetical protein